MHTPGPWHVSKHSNYVRKTDDDWPAWNICDMNSANGSFKADARLIAAAPDLLAALEACRNELVAVLREDSGMTEAAIKDFPILLQANAAIAKAKAGKE